MAKCRCWFHEHHPTRKAARVSFSSYADWTSHSTLDQSYEIAIVIATHCFEDKKKKQSHRTGPPAGIARQYFTNTKHSRAHTFLPVAQGDCFASLATPDNTGLGWARRGAAERHVGSLSHYHVRAGRVVQDVRWNCNQKYRWNTSVSVYNRHGHV
jgi:hypothetical protein